MTIKEIIDEMERLLTLGYSQKEIWEIKKITFKEQNEALLKLKLRLYLNNAKRFSITTQYPSFLFSPILHKLNCCTDCFSSKACKY